MKSQYQLTVKDLTAAVQNAKSEGVNSLVIQLNGVDYHVKNAAIVPQRNHSDLTLFVGAPVNKESVNPIKSYLSFLSGTKPNKTPTNKEITPAVIATIEQLFNGSDITTKSLLEIKTALATAQKHFEQLSNSQSPFNSNSNSLGGGL